nr:GPI-anchored adhesin-like protein precursor [Ipomoea batatas]
MAISHLLQLKSASHINRIGILRSRILYSSLPSDGNSEKKPQPKKSDLAKQQKAQAVESFVKKYMKENQGMFPKPMHVQNEVGGSWHNLKGMLEIVKDKMMGKFDKRNISGALTSTSDPEVSSDIPSHKVDNSGDEPQVHEQAVQEGTTTVSNNDEHANPTMPSLDGQSSSQVFQSLVKKFQNSKIARKESNQTTASEETLSDIVSMPSEGTKELHDLAVNKSGYSGYQNFSPEDYLFSLSTYTETERDKQFLLSDNAHETIQLKHHLVDSIKDQTAERIANSISDAYIPSFHQQSSEPSGDTDVLSSDIEGLIECVKSLPQPLVGRPQETINFNKSDHSSSRTTRTGIKQPGNMQKFEKQEISISSMLDQEGPPSLVNIPKSEKKAGSTASLNYPSMVEKNGIDSPFTELLGNLNIEDQETSCSAALHCNKSNESGQNKVIVRFLPRMVVSEDIIGAFKDYGDISKVKIRSTEGSFFKAAYVYFKSDEGKKKALEGADVNVRNQTVTVEAAFSLKDVTKTYIPNLIGLPDVPAALVKNPKRTVLIKNLARDIRSHHIENALYFCKSKISQFFLGSSSSVAYVEFETEEGKENALTRHSINLLGRRLQIFRVDVPRTTVVRISNVLCIPVKKLILLCKSFGKLRRVSHRNGNIMDVHFRLAEWPNMATILNRLNGSQIDGQRVVAQPAPVYPPDVLLALWSQPEGRRHLRSSVHNLLIKLRENDPSEAGTAVLVNSLLEDTVEI